MACGCCNCCPRRGLRARFQYAAQDEARLRVWKMKKIICLIARKIAKHLVNPLIRGFFVKNKNHCDYGISDKRYPNADR